MLPSCNAPCIVLPFLSLWLLPFLDSWSARVVLYSSCQLFVSKISFITRIHDKSRTRVQCTSSDLRDLTQARAQVRCGSIGQTQKLSNPLTSARTAGCVALSCAPLEEVTLNAAALSNPDPVTCRLSATLRYSPPPSPVY
jgi:hypothetical protein